MVHQTDSNKKKFKNRKLQLLEVTNVTIDEQISNYN